jgi:hypothetical protein
MSKIVVVAVLFVGIAIGALSLWRDQVPNSHSKFALWQSDLRTVASVVFYYAEDHQGVLPNPNSWLAVMNEMEPDVVYPEPVFGDNNQDNIWMCPIPWEDGRIPDDLTRDQLALIPMLHEKLGLNPNGTSVAFWDGSVRLLSNDEFAALINVEDSICLGCQFPVPEFLREEEP